MTDKTDSKEREALRSIGEEQAFEAWFKVDCPVGGANAKIAAKAAWKARASIDPSGFDAADMATASAQGFRDGVASLAASAGSEPVPFGHWFTDDPKAFATPGSGFLVGKEPPKNAINVIPLYTHPSPPEGMVGGWIAIPGALPEPGVPVLLDIGKKYPIRAMWAAKHTVQAADDDTDWGEYDEATDTYYCPEGWYEWNECEDNHWAVSSTPRAWAPLPPTSSADSRKGE